MAASGPAPNDVEAKMLELAEFPLQLCNVMDSQILRAAARKLASLFPELSYIRMVLVSDTVTPVDVLEMCCDQSMSTAMAGLQSNSTAQDACMRQEASLLSSQPELGGLTYDDWQLLQAQFDMQSFAAIPIIAGGAVHGCMLLSAKPNGYLSSRWSETLECFAAMIAPYAAMHRKHQQLQNLKPLLQRMLPPRVAASVLHNACWNTNPLGLRR